MIVFNTHTPRSGDTVWVENDHHTILTITHDGHAYTDVYTSPGMTRGGFITRDALRNARRSLWGGAWEIVSSQVESSRVKPS